MAFAVSRRRLVVLAIATLVVLAGLVVGSFPLRAIIDQRRETAESSQELAALDEEVGQLEARIARLNDPEEIKRLARERYNYVPPGWESYRTITPPAADVTLPEGWPFVLGR